MSIRFQAVTSLSDLAANEANPAKEQAIQELQTAAHLVGQEIRVNDWSPRPGWVAEISFADGRTVRLAAELARELIAPLLART